MCNECIVLKKKNKLLLEYVNTSEIKNEVIEGPLLDPVEDYKDYYRIDKIEPEKTTCKFRFNKHSFSFNYIHEIDYNFIKSVLHKHSEDNKTVNIDKVINGLNSLNSIQKARIGNGTQFTNTDNYTIFCRYAGWEFDSVNEQVLNSGVDLSKKIKLSLHFGKLSKYDVDGLAKAIIDTFANYFLKGNDNNIVELHLTAEDVEEQKDGFVDFIIENI